jgi:hypothetical protein
MWLAAAQFTPPHFGAVSRHFAVAECEIVHDHIVIDICVHPWFLVVAFKSGASGIMQQHKKNLIARLSQNEDGFVWATPTMLGLLLLSSGMGRLLFWLPTLEGARQIPVSAHLSSLFALPFGIAALMILAAKRRNPGPDWQHSHWQYHLRTLVMGAVGGCTVAVIYFPAVTQSAMSVQRLLVGGAVLISVSLLILIRTLRAIRASERKLPIGV